MKKTYRIVSVIPKNPEHPSAIHYTTLQKNYERKNNCFRSFFKQHGLSARDYKLDIEMTSTDVEKRYNTKSRAKESAERIARNNGFLVKHKGSVWGPVQRKASNIPTYNVEPLPADAMAKMIRNCMGSHCGPSYFFTHCARVLFDHDIPMFTKSTRRLALDTLLKNYYTVYNELWETWLDQAEQATTVTERMHYDNLYNSLMDVEINKWSQSNNCLKEIWSELAKNYDQIIYHDAIVAPKPKILVV